MTQATDIPGIPEDRKESLFQLWNTETDDPETMEWRDNLTPVEEIYGESLDRGFTVGCRQISTVILIMEDIYRAFPMSSIREITRRGSHCRLELKDGRFFDCWLDKNDQVQYREEESRA